MLGECANVRMCKCANGRLCTRNLSICTFTFTYILTPICALTKLSINAAKRGDYLHICTFSHLHIHQAFAHSHICTLTKHLHISQAIHKRSKKRRQFAHLHILTFAHFPSICTLTKHLHINYMTAIVVFILFIVMQFVAGLGALLFSNLDKLGTDYPMDQLSVNPVATGISLLVAEGILALGLWLWYYRFEGRVRSKAETQPELLSIFKFRPLKRDVQQRPVTVFNIIYTTCCCLIIASSVSDALTHLHITAPNTVNFEGMMHNPLCLLLLCFVGPLCEELVFRVGVVRSLYRHNVPGWAAAAIGALAFALVHGNLAQGIPAFIIGFILGIAYLRTGDLRLCLPMHIANNAFAVYCTLFAAPDVLSWPSIVFYTLFASFCFYTNLYHSKE